MQKIDKNIPELVTKTDIVRRWIFTREGVRKRIRQDFDFPLPVTYVNNGRTPLWLLSDIKEYEKVRPYLTDETEKQIYMLRNFYRSQYYN